MATAMRCQLRKSQTPPKNAAITSANAPSTRKREDAGEGIAAVGSVGSALVEATVDVRSVANAKDIEAAKKSA